MGESKPSSKTGESSRKTDSIGNSGTNKEVNKQFYNKALDEDTNLFNKKDKNFLRYQSEQLIKDTKFRSKYIDPIKEKFGIEPKPEIDGVGVRFDLKNKSDSIRIMRGEPKRLYLCQHQDYAKVVLNGKTYNKYGGVTETKRSIDKKQKWIEVKDNKGNILEKRIDIDPAEHPASHIPLNKLKEILGDINEK